MRTIPILLLTLMLVHAPRARAEINIAPSLEWLTASADRVVVGKVVSVRAADPAAKGKNRGLVLTTLQVSETLKGAHEPLLCVGLRDVDGKRLEEQRKAGAELLLFLEATVQATSFEKRVCNHWPLRDGGGVLLPSLSAPGKSFLSASTFKVLRQRAEILAACQGTLRRLAPAKGAKPVPAKKHFLEVPFQSEVFKVLYSGSSCFLEVPDRLFPRSRPRLGS